MTQPRIEIYTKAHCPYCDRAKQLLRKKQLDFQEIPIDQDDNKHEEMKQRTQGKKTVPQIFINNALIGGCDALYELERTHELDKRLQSS